MKKRDFVNGCNGCGVSCPNGRFILHIPEGKDLFYCKSCFNKVNIQDRNIKEDVYSKLVKDCDKEGINILGVPKVIEVIKGNKENPKKEKYIDYKLYEEYEQKIQDRHERLKSINRKAND